MGVNRTARRTSLAGGKSRILMVLWGQGGGKKREGQVEGKGEWKHQEGGTVKKSTK